MNTLNSNNSDHNNSEHPGAIPSRIEELTEFADNLFTNRQFLFYPPWKQERVFLRAAQTILTQPFCQAIEQETL